jgi:hypothetical protein
MGASAIAPPIAAAANHGARYLIFVFMMFSRLLGRPVWATYKHRLLDEPVSSVLTPVQPRC